MGMSGHNHGGQGGRGQGRGGGRGGGRKGGGTDVKKAKESQEKANLCK
jgi:hypothetical protein